MTKDNKETVQLINPNKAIFKGNKGNTSDQKGIKLTSGNSKDRFDIKLYEPQADHASSASEDEGSNEGQVKGPNLVTKNISEFAYYLRKYKYTEGNGFFLKKEDQTLHLNLLKGLVQNSNFNVYLQETFCVDKILTGILFLELILYKNGLERKNILLKIQHELNGSNMLKDEIVLEADRYEII